MRLLNRRVIGVALAVVVFLWSWTFLDHWFYAKNQISDIAVYQQYGVGMHDGHVPYRDFAVDYPPASLPVFVLPTFGAKTTELDGSVELGNYGRWFARLMGACGLALLVFVMLARPPSRAVWLVAVSPLVVGQLMADRFDLWPAALVAAAVAAFVRDRHRLGYLALAVAFSAKLFPAVLLPLAAIWTFRRRGRAELTRGLAIFAAAAAAIFVPFAVLAPHGVWETIWGQAERPIQIESLAGSYLTTFANPSVIFSHDSPALAGHGTLAFCSTLAELVVIVVLWVAFARGPADRDRLLRYSAACVCAFIAFGKVLSPQYTIWLVPLVPLVGGRRGLAACVLLAAAMIDTQYWFWQPHYSDYINEYKYADLVLARNLALVALVPLLALPAAATRRTSWRSRTRSPARA
jgi:hypothetical protein